MHLSGGEIGACTFESCHQTSGGATLLNVNSNNRDGIGCMIYASNSCLTENNFVACGSSTDISYAYSNERKFCALLILNRNSLIENCSFEEIHLSGQYHDGGGKTRQSATATICLCDGTEQNNTGEYTVESITEVPKEFFTVGFNNYQD